MSSPPAPIDYDEVARQLEAASLATGPAEAQGIACGLLISGNVAQARDDWLADMFAETDPQDVLAAEARRTLQAVFDAMVEELDGPGAGFTMLLPDDTHTLAQRARAVRDWCRGFLYGFGLAGVDVERMLSAEGREALQDLVEVTRMEEDPVPTESNEDALVELVEFLWVAAMLIREEVVHYRERH